MAREKRGETKRIPIDLDLSDPDERALWEHWEKLTKRGDAARWARRVLISAVQSVDSERTEPVQNMDTKSTSNVQQTKATTTPASVWQGKPVPKSGTPNGRSSPVRKADIDD